MIFQVNIWFLTLFMKTMGTHGIRRRRPISDSFTFCRFRDVAHFSCDPFSAWDVINNILVSCFHESLKALLSSLRGIIPIAFLSVWYLVVLDLRMRFHINIIPFYLILLFSIINISIYENCRKLKIILHSSEKLTFISL